MKLSQLQKRIQKTLTISKDIIQKAESRRNKDQRAVKQMSEAWALYKSIHTGCPGVTFLGTDKKKKIGNEIGITFSHAIKNRLSK